MSHQRLAAIALGLALALLGSSARAEQPRLRHEPNWVRERLASMLAVDDAYLWHEVLGGRAIHQNSSANPPTEPLEGNFHTQQQGYFALMKMHVCDVLGGDAKQLDDADTLLDWVLDNGYDAERRYLYFRYNDRSKSWEKSFYPEFNMITVAALLRYDSLRPTPRYRDAANQVFDTILRVGWDADHRGFMSGFKPDTDTDGFSGGGSKGLYGSGYLALMMLDAYDSTGERRFLEWAQKAVDPCNEYLWDHEHGAWTPGASRDWSKLEGTTKLTHVIADMIQANYLLFLHGQGRVYLDFAENGMAFLAEHSRAPNGLWYRHTTRDGSDPTLGPDLAADRGPGTAAAYDRQMQVVVACSYGWKATGNRNYLDYIDDTLDAMEQTHRIDYPAGVNYGYMGKDNAQNTWCHLWGLKGFAAIARLQQERSDTP